MPEKLKIFCVGPGATVKEMSATIASIVSSDQAHLIDVVCTLFHKTNWADQIFQRFIRFVLIRMGKFGAWIVASCVKVDIVGIIYVQSDGKAFRNGDDICLVVATDKIPKNTNHNEWDVEYNHYMSEEFHVRWVQSRPVWIEDEALQDSWTR